MTPNHRILGAAALSLALAGGGVAGAMLDTPSTSLAQSTSATDHSAGPAAYDRGAGRFVPRGEALAITAEVLGMSEDDLKAALTDGKSIADVAADQGVDVQDVVDALVADTSARLDELQAELPDRMTELVNRTGWGDHRPGHRPGVIREGLETAAEVIGITADELRTELRDGSTIAEVTTANGVDVQEVIDALVADAEARIDEAVADGKLDADHAEEMKANLTERVTARVNGEHPVGARPSGPGHRGGPEA